MHKSRFLLFVAILVVLSPALKLHAETADEFETKLPEGTDCVEHVNWKNTPKDFVRNLSTVFLKQDLMPLFLGSGVTGLAFALDENEFDGEDDFFDPLHESEEGSAAGKVGQIMGGHFVMPTVVAALSIAGLSSDNSKFKLFSYSLIQGYLVNNVLTIGLKTAVGRTRPNLQNDRSFPSGHSSNAFLLATITGHYYGKKVAIPAYAVASFIAWSRLDLDAHYLSDVVFGAVLGYFVGKTVIQNSDAHLRERNFAWYPIATSQGGGFLLSYRW